MGFGQQASTGIRKSERTRQEILEAALEFLWTHPFRDLTVAELMSNTGTTRSAFYRYFSDLHELMEALLAGLEQQILAIAEPWFTILDDPPARLAESLEGLVKVCYQQGPIIRAVVDAAPMDERLEASWNRFVQVFDDAVTQRIEVDQDSGLIGQFDARAVAIALNQMDIGVLMHHFGRRPRSKPEPVLQSISQIWISTIYGKEALKKLIETGTGSLQPNAEGG